MDSTESLSDATSQRENNLAAALGDCASECNRLRRELEETRLSLKAATEETQQVVYAVGHDLRAALRNVMSYSQLLQRQPMPNDETREFLGMIISGAQDMSRFIDDVLKFSRAGNSPRPTHIDLGTVAQMALFQLDDEIREHGAKVELGDLPEATVDESHFAQVFQQLFANSLVYRGPEPPRIDVFAEEGPDGHIISVQDNGIGLKPEFSEIIFMPFKRLHGKERPGNGLGLAICRKILRLRGGTIWAESDGERGTTFKFTIPYEYNRN